MKTFDEGLGTVYERFMLNSFFDVLLDRYPVKEVLEVPIYGMTGLTGINSVHFAEKGCKVTLLDSSREKIQEAIELWKLLPYDGLSEAIWHQDLSRLPFRKDSFDLVWAFAAIWHINEAEKLLSEMARVSSNLVLVFVPNKRQIGYLLRKYIFDKPFFKVVDERWAEIERVSSVLSSMGFKMRDRGVLDIPPWPDTCVPVGPLLDKLGIRKNGEGNGSKGRWSWDIMSYYLGADKTLRERVERFSFLERMPIPTGLKVLWAHHRYVMFSKN